MPSSAGLGNAYSVVVNDDNWKSDKFRIISGGNNFTLDFLNAGDQYVHEFMVVPIKKTWHRIRPAKMAFIDGVEGENTSACHATSQRPRPDIRIAAPASSPWETYLLTAGRVVTLNTIQTREGWSYVGAALLAYVVLQVALTVKAVIQKRQHLRALDDVKKM